MSIRLKRLTQSAVLDRDQMVINVGIAQRETTVDGYTFHWGINEVRNFLDDGVGVAHAAFATNADAIVQNTIPFGDSRS